MCYLIALISSKIVEVNQTSNPNTTFILIRDACLVLIE